MLDPLPLVHEEPKFCPRDGTPLGEELKAGKPRLVCPKCGYIYGRDPRVIVGLIIEQGDKLLFIERTSGDHKARALPLYFFRERADPRELAAISFEKETGLRVRPGAVVDAFNARDEALGPNLVLLFRANLLPPGIAGRADLRFAHPLAADLPAPTPLTLTVLDRVAASL